MKWVETKGRKPRTGDKPLYLRFRRGTESRFTYTADQMIFQHRGWEYDVVAVAIARDA